MTILPQFNAILMVGFIYIYIYIYKNEYVAVFDIGSGSNMFIRHHVVFEIYGYVCVTRRVLTVQQWLINRAKLPHLVASMIVS